MWLLTHHFFFHIYFTVASNPRCYNQSDPELNSTAWFAEYIGPFMPFLTLEVFQSFGSAQVLKRSSKFQFLLTENEEIDNRRN